MVIIIYPEWYKLSFKETLTWNVSVQLGMGLKWVTATWNQQLGQCVVKKCFSATKILSSVRSFGNAASFPHIQPGYCNLPEWYMLDFKQTLAWDLPVQLGSVLLDQRVAKKIMAVVDPLTILFFSSKLGDSFCPDFSLLPDGIYLRINQPLKINILFHLVSGSLF